MTTELRRVQPLAAGQYSKRVTGSVALACPCCGNISKLDWPYRIAQTGFVAPKWLCHECSWSGEIRLVDFWEQQVP